MSQPVTRLCAVRAFSQKPFVGNLAHGTAEYLTTFNECDNNCAWTERSLCTPAENSKAALQPGKEIPPGEDGMDFEKDNFEDDNELSRLEDDEELGGEAQEIVEAEEEELAIVGEEPEEEAPAPRPAADRPAPKKPAAKKKVAPKKKAKAKPKKKAKKPARKAAKKKRR